MNKCYRCESEPELKTNQPEDKKIFDENVRFKVACPKCGIETSFYKTMESAEVAWDTKK